MKTPNWLLSAGNFLSELCLNLAAPTIAKNVDYRAGVFGFVCCFHLLPAVLACVRYLINPSVSITYVREDHNSSHYYGD